MKVSELIDRLKVGDTVWVKGEVNYTNKAELFSICCDLAETSFWICDDDEISLTKPQAEKVEVPDFVAEWYRTNKADLESNIAASFRRIGSDEHYTKGSIYEWLNDSSNNPIQTLFKMKDGYTVKSKRWVTKNEKGYVAMENFEDFDNHKMGVKFTIASEKSEAAYWDDIDRAKAEAVATLVEGSVEEV